MKKSLPPGVIVAAVVVVLIVIGFAAYKTFGGDPAAGGATPTEVKQMNAVKSRVRAAHRDANGHYVDDQGKPLDFSTPANSASGN